MCIQMKVWLYTFHVVSKVISIADYWKELPKFLLLCLFSYLFLYLVKLYCGRKLLKVYIAFQNGNWLYFFKDPVLWNHFWNLGMWIKWKCKNLLIKSFNLLCLQKNILKHLFDSLLLSEECQRRFNLFVYI